MPGTGTADKCKPYAQHRLLWPGWTTLYPFCRVSEYCSFRGKDLLKEVPNLLCSCEGSTRASTAVLSQIEATPGAAIAAHGVPEDCDGGASVENFCRSRSELVKVWG